VEGLAHEDQCDRVARPAVRQQQRAYLVELGLVGRVGGLGQGLGVADQAAEVVGADGHRRSDLGAGSPGRQCLGDRGGLLCGQLDLVPGDRREPRRRRHLVERVDALGRGGDASNLLEW
jgi:hypothetical protein